MEQERLYNLTNQTSTTVKEYEIIQNTLFDYNKADLSVKITIWMENSQSKQHISMYPLV